MAKFIFTLCCKIILPLTLLITLIFTTNCKDPNTYKPPVDSLLPPPPPPELLTPPDSFIHIPQGDNRLLISWEILEGAEIYEISFVDLNIMKEWSYTLKKNYIAQSWLGYYSRFTWRVRAYGPTWEYYTDWSVPRYYEVVRKPLPPPALIYPPNDTIFYVDTLPANIEFIWSEVPKAKSYDYEVYLDGNIVYEYTLNTTHTVILIDSAATYNWCVRANTPLWEFPTGWAYGTFTVQLR